MYCSVWKLRQLKATNVENRSQLSPRYNLGKGWTKCDV